MILPRPLALLVVAVATVAALCATATAAPKSGGMPSEREALERLYAIEDHRNHEDKFLVTALGHPSARVQKAAILAMGRVGHTGFVDNLAPLATHRDVTIREAALFSLGLIGGDMALSLLTQHAQLAGPPAARAEAWRGAGRAGNDKTVFVFAGALKNEQVPAVRIGILNGLGNLWTRHPRALPPKDLLPILVEMASGGDALALPAAFALARYKGDFADVSPVAVVAALRRARDTQAKALLIRAASRVKSLEIAKALKDLTGPKEPLAVRIEAASATEAFLPDPAAVQSWRKSVSDPRPEVQVSALEALFRNGKPVPELAFDIEPLVKRSPSPWVRAAALQALASASPDGARPHLEAALDPASPLFGPALIGIALKPTDGDLQRLAQYLADPSPRTAGRAAEALTFLAEEKHTDAIRASMKRALLLGDIAVTAMLAQVIKSLDLSDFAPALVSAYRHFQAADQVEGKLAVLDALSALKSRQAIPLLETAMDDPHRQVAMAAASAYRATASSEPKHALRLNSQVDGLTPSYDEIRAALACTISIKTDRGELSLAMLEQAPLTVSHFVSLVKKGFYDGKIFHRVVPHFVAQGGDPRGDGYGGPGFFVRDEVSPLPHSRGTVGIATAGKDTGGSQFFFNLAPNLHLAGQYTLFARVISGESLLDQIEKGDKILWAKARCPSTKSATGTRAARPS